MTQKLYSVGLTVLLLFSLAAASVAIMVFVSTDQISSLGSDNVSYLLMAEWLSPYHEASPIIREAALQQSYPPLFSLVLALSGASADYLWAHRVVAIWFLIACLLLYCLARKMLASKGLAVVVVIGFLVTPASWINLLGILSENQYLAISLGVFLSLRREKRGPWQFALLALALVALVLTRSIGLAMVVAMLASCWVLAPRWLECRWRWTLASAVAVIVMILWGALSPVQGDSHYLALWSGLLRELGQSGLSEMTNLLAFQAVQIWEGVLTALIHHWPIEGGVTFYLVFLMLIIALIDVGFRLRHGEAEAAYLVVFLLVLLCWGSAGGQMWRLVYPCIPLLLIFMVSGIQRIVGLSKNGRASLALHVLLCGIFVVTPMGGGAFVLARYELSSSAEVAAYRHVTSYYQTIESHRAEFKARTELTIIEGLKHVGSITEPDAVVAWFSPMYVSLFSNRRSVQLSVNLGIEEAAAFVKENQVDYIFLSRYHPRQYSDNVDGLASLNNYLSIGKVVWSGTVDQEGSSVVVCVLIEM